MRLNVTLYRTMAYITGTVLIVLCVFTVMQAFAKVSGIVLVIGDVHGALYIVYLITAYPLTKKLGLATRPTIGVLLAGTVPVMTFIVENRIRHRYINPALAREEAAGSVGTAPLAQEPR